MKNYRSLTVLTLRLPALALAGLLLAGCATYHGTRDDGVYYEAPNDRGSAVRVDPTLYPYWSLDYFYYSHYYHPYSVLVDRFDPWYYPYPGWYYGYRPGPRHVGQFGHFRYPWYRLGNRYAGYRSWHHGHWDHDRHPRERYDGRNRVRQIDARLRALETRRSLSIRGQRPDRRLTPRTSPWLPATGRGAALRRDELRRPPPPVRPGTRSVGPGGEAERRQDLIERLRAVDRSTRLPERSSDRRPTSPPTPRQETRPRQRTVNPGAPARQRPAEPAPPRSTPQRRGGREPAPPANRARPPQGRARSDRRERR